MQYLIILITLVSTITSLCYSQPSVLKVAELIQYYDRVRDLRSKSIDHLLILESIMKDKVNTLRTAGHDQIADVKEIEYRDMYLAISDEFDQEFDTFERRIILAGEELDDQDAPLSAKKSLVASNLEGLTSAINYIITKYYPRSIT